jgi:nicotinamide-nucleotide amidase
MMSTQPFSVLAHELAEQLRTKNLKITLAESCTGGLLAAQLTDLSHASQWFDRGFVTYSNEAKTELIGVSPTLIENHGAVSEEVAQAMARGALANSRAQVSIAITGIAGPGGGSAHKPVGMVCFAWAIRKNNAIKQNSITKQFKGNRQKIREQACKYAVHQTLEFLNKL